MNKAYREYTYNGWDIRASELYNNWEVQIKIKDESQISIWEEFCNKEYITFDTLKEAKAWTKTEEAKQLLIKYLGN